jgi:hypothetical protein
MTSGKINFLEPSGSLQACKWTALLLPLHKPNVRCSQVEQVARGKEKVSILDLNVFWFIKHFIVLRLVLQALYYPEEVQLSTRDTFCLGLDFRIAWLSAALQQDELPVLANYRRIRKGRHLPCTPWT